MRMMSKNVLAFVFFAALGVFGSACAAGDAATENDDSTEGQEFALGNGSNAESSNPSAKGGAPNVPVTRAFSSDPQIKAAPVPQPWAPVPQPWTGK